MDSARVVAAVVRHDLRKLLFSWRTLIALMLATGLILLSADTARALCARHDVGISPFSLFISLWNTDYTGTVLVLCLMMIVCDAPFIDECQPMILLRCGRYLWSVGQILYMLIVAALYFAYVFIASLLIMAPYLEWTMEWGVVYRSFSETREGLVIDYSRDIMNRYTPGRALMLTAGYNYALCVVMAQMMYAVNMVTDGNYGIILPCVMLMLNYFFVGWFLDASFLYISPVSFVKLKLLDRPGGPTGAYACGTLAGLLVFSAAACVLSIRRRAITVRKPI